MNAQLKRGVIEVCILAALYKEDSYGYEIVKKLSGIVEISESTLYPILKRLEAANSLTVYSIEHNSRLRKYYKITDNGKEKIQEFIDEWTSVIDVYDYIKEATKK